VDYLENAYVYDEKVQDSEAFSIQRRRWLSAQFHYFFQDIGSATKDLFFKGNVDYFVKAIQFIQPPRILLLGLVCVEAPLFIIVNKLIGLNRSLSEIWLIVFVSCIISFLFSVPIKFYNKKTAKAILDLPKGMLLMLVSLLKIKGANKQFLHTPHGTVETEK